MQVDVLDSKGVKTGRTVNLPEDIFDVEPNTHVMYLAVKQYLAAQRQGTSKVKTRKEVHGSSKKLHKQKGTGGARKGNIRNPLYKGGGTVFGPKPRDYSFKLNKNVKDLARVSALSTKAKNNAIVVVEDLAYQAPKTKDFAALLTNLNVAQAKSLFVMAEPNNNVYLSLRNIPTVLGTLLSDLNTYDIMNATNLVFTETSAKLFGENETVHNYNAEKAKEEK